MKTFKQLIAEVAQPNNEDELNFKEKHSIEVTPHPHSKEHQHTAEKKSPKRRADYDEGEDEEVYEAKMDPVGQEDDDIDNDGDVDSSDEYLHARRKAIAKAMKKEAATSPYAIGMAAAMKQTGDEPPLKKSTITKAHKIAKGIMKDDEVDESAFVAKAAAAHKDGKKKFKLGDKEFPVTIKKATADKIALESAELLENEQMAAIGRKLQQMAPKEKNDMISNAMANLGDHLESFGTPFGARNMKELERKTGLNAAVIQALIKKANTVKESAEQIDEVSKGKLKNYMDAARKDMRNRYYDDSPESDKKYFNRSKGIEKALDKRDANSKAKVPATESYELSENFKAGSVKLNDGSSVIVKDQDAKLLNQMFADLNADNKKRMMKVAMADKKGFNEILGFAREAL